MTLFAALDNATIAVIVGTIWAILKFVEKVYDNHQTDKAAKALALRMKEAEDAAAAKIEELGDKVAEVAHNTNSIKDELVAEVRKASFAEGKKSETDKTPGLSDQIDEVKEDVAEVPAKTVAKLKEKE